MGTLNKETEFIKTLREFIAFLQSLWGILAGISIFFPLSNDLIKLIPLRRLHDDPAGALGYLSRLDNGCRYAHYLIRCTINIR
jgi:hypothetical protein